MKMTRLLFCFLSQHKSLDGSGDADVFLLLF